MQQCWARDPLERPHFLEIVEEEHKILDNIGDAGNSEDSDEEYNKKLRRNSSQHSTRSGMHATALRGGAWFDEGGCSRGERKGDLIIMVSSF